jgi:hypothetical protein
VDVTAPVHTVPKSEQRRFIRECFLTPAAEAQMGGGGGGIGNMNLLVVDDFNGGSSGLFCAELLRMGANPARIFSPNVKPEVVDALKAINIGFAEQLSAHVFLAKHAMTIQQMGRLHLAFIDVHGGYERGAMHLVELIAHLGLLVQSGDPIGRHGALLCFAASGRDVTRHQPRVVHASSVGRHVARQMFDAGYMAVPAVLPEWLTEAYFTMQFHAWNVIHVQNH